MGRHGILTAIATPPLSIADGPHTAAASSAGLAGERPHAWVLSLRAWEGLGLGLLVLAAVVGFVAFPTFPNYDSYYSMLWGRELLGLHHLSFEAYRAPTEHPLAIGFGALLSLLGEGGDRVMIAFAIASFVALATGMYALGKTAFTPLVGFVAAGLVCTRFDFPFLAARGYIDISYLAVVIWAAVIEARAPRRHPFVVLTILTGAGLMRPEAWLLIGLYWLWLFASLSWPARVRYALLSAIAPVVWAGTDLLVTGNPIFSLTSTSELADELGRNKGLSAVPGALYAFLIKLDKFPVFAAAVIGALLALALVPRRTTMPATLFAAGAGTFAMVGVAGLSIIDRYLLVPSLMVMIFAAVGIGGWTMLREGALARRIWMLGAAALVIFGIVFTVGRVSLHKLDVQLKFRNDSHLALRSLLHQPAVVRALRCGPVYVPNHKLIPDVRWLLDVDQKGVLARSNPKTAAPTRGVVLLVHERQAIFAQALVTAQDDPINNLPPDGFDRIGTSAYYAAYARC